MMKIFNGDSTITSAVRDRLLHQPETVVIEGSSYLMKDRVENLEAFKRTAPALRRVGRGHGLQIQFTGVCVFSNSH